MNEDISHKLNEHEISHLLGLDDNDSMSWTINFDLDTKHPDYNERYYSTIHSFLEKYGFEYRQHSGDISSYKMSPSEIIFALDSLYDKYPKIKNCTKSCLFTSINESYSFTEIRKEQSKMTPKETSFSIHLEIKKEDAMEIFNTDDYELIECNIRDMFNHPSNLKQQMYPIANKKSDGSISIDWNPSIGITSLNKTIATNHIFAKYPKLLDRQRNIIFEINFDGQTTNIITEQQRIEVEENKRLIEYDMSTKKFGKKEYDSLNNTLKTRLKYFGLKHTQESGWMSEKGMTDEQVQAILSELFNEKCKFDKITQVMDISIIRSKIYDYIELDTKRNPIIDNNQNNSTSGINNKKSKRNGKQDFADTSSRDSVNDTKMSKEKDEFPVISDEDIKLDSLRDSGYDKSAVEEFLMFGEISENENDRSLLD